MPCSAGAGSPAGASSGYRKDQRERLAWGDALFDPASARCGPPPPRARPGRTGAPDRPRDRPLADQPPRLVGREGPRPGLREPPRARGSGLVFVPFGFDPEEAFRADLYYMMGDSDLF